MNKSNLHNQKDMTLKFVKEKASGDISLFIDDKEFDSDDYIKIIKNIADKEKLAEPQFDGEFSDMEKKKIKSMVQTINEIDGDNIHEKEDEEINPEDIPF